MKPASRILAFLSLAIGIQQPAVAVDFFWDGNSTTANADGGSGNWNTTLTNWGTLATAGANTAWPSTGTDNDAVFGGTAGTVTVDPGRVTANTLTFNTANHVLTGDKLTLNLNGGTLKTAGGATNLIDNQNSGSQISVFLGAGNTTAPTRPRITTSNPQPTT